MEIGCGDTLSCQHRQEYMVRRSEGISRKAKGDNPKVPGRWAQSRLGREMQGGENRLINDESVRYASYMSVKCFETQLLDLLLSQWHPCPRGRQRVRLFPVNN